MTRDLSNPKNAALCSSPFFLLAVFRSIRFVTIAQSLVSAPDLEPIHEEKHIGTLYTYMRSGSPVSDYKHDPWSIVFLDSQPIIANLGVYYVCRVPTSIPMYTLLEAVQCTLYI